MRPPGRRDGARILTTSNDNTARVWDADDRGAPFILKGHEGTIRVAAWSPDGTHILTASEDNTARVWLIDIGLLQQALREATADCLSSNQRQTHLLESEADATRAHDACERAHGREPALEAAASGGIAAVAD